MQYRREIDGLRAIAVLPVILFHAGIPGWDGGYLGVDVFFVISGYLITSILIGDIRSGNFSLLRFYERRARRILPALFVVLLACMPMAWLWMPPGMMEDFGQSLIATVLFFSNVHFWENTGYFATDTELLPLLHTWSLAVEEQFYLFFPLLLLFLMRFGWAFAALLGLSVLSLLLAEWGWRNEPAVNFFFTLSRIWELLAGALCALALARQEGFALANPRAVREGASLAGSIAVIGALAVFDASYPMPSIWGLIPVLGVAAIILFAQSDTLVGRVLGWSPLVGIGLISYSAYLWHQPIFAFARLRDIAPPAPALAVVLIALTFVLAVFSWRFVEQPMRHTASTPLVTRKGVFGGAIAVSFGFAVLGVLLGWMDGVSLRFDHMRAAGLEPDKKVLQKASWALLRIRLDNRKYTVEGNAADLTNWFADDGRKKLLVVGNSHSKDVYNILTQSAKITKSHEIARFGAQIADLKEQDHALYSSPNFIAADVIVLASRYQDGDCSEAGKTCKDDLGAIAEVMSRISGLGKEVILSGNAPEFPDNGAWTLVDTAALRGTLDQNAIGHNAYQAMLADERVRELNNRLKKLAALSGAAFLDRVALHCNRATETCPLLTDAGQKVMYDGHHLTLAGAEMLGSRADLDKWLSMTALKTAGG